MPGNSFPEDPAAFDRAYRTQPHVMARLVTDLDVAVHDEHDVLDVMSRVALAAQRDIDGADHVGITIFLGGDPFTVAPTDDTVRRIDSGQYQCGDGPCLQATRTDRHVLMTVNEIERRWPTLGACTRGAAIAAIAAAPIHDSHGAVGSLNLYTGRGDHHMAEAADLITVLSGYLDRAIRRFGIARSRPEAAQALRAAVSERATIDQAVGILMQRLNVNHTAAHQELDATARITARTQLQAAEHVIRRG